MKLYHFYIQKFSTTTLYIMVVDFYKNGNIKALLQRVNSRNMRIKNVIQISVHRSSSILWNEIDKNNVPTDILNNLYAKKIKYVSNKYRKINE